MGTKTDYFDKAIYEVSESERKTKIDEETMKKLSRVGSFQACWGKRCVAVGSEETMKKSRK